MMIDIQSPIPGFSFTELLVSSPFSSLMDQSSSSNTTSSTSPTVDNPSIPAPEHEDLSSCARDLVNALSVNSLNLANPDVLTQVDWVQSGRSSTSTLVVNHKDENDQLYRPAILEFVGEISPASFWLYACGGWNGDRGPTNSWSKPCPFEKARARAHVRRSSFPFYARLWTPAIDNLKKIINLGVTRVSNARDKGIDYNVVYGNEIRIRHSVFFVRMIKLHIVMTTMMI
jgi:hypothetical protein